MSSPAPKDDSISQLFSISLTVYSDIIKKSSVKGKTTTKEQKDVKTKELLFAPDPLDYIKFLEAILLKHGLEHYEVTEKKHFPLKYGMTKTKAQRLTVADSIDVDNATDYKEMVKKILNEKPTIVKLIVDMRHVKKLLRSSKSSRSSEDNSLRSSESPTGKSTSKQVKKADLDNRLARWRLKLIKVHKNENDDGLTYIGPLGPIALTPAMVRDWCLTLEDGLATIAIPPNIESFNAANKVPILHPTRKAAVQPTPVSAAPDITALTSVILLQTLAQMQGLIQSPTAPTPCTLTPTNPAPRTPTRRANSDVAASPQVHAPTQLARYLQFAEIDLEVPHALSYQAALEQKGIGPDIFNDFSNKFYTDLGVLPGDVIRLKRGSESWWKEHQAEVKRKRSDTSESTSAAVEPGQPSAKRVAYEKRYHGGGGCRFSGPPMRSEDGNMDPAHLDYKLWYKCETLKQWFPVPPGYSVDEAGDSDADADDFAPTY